MQFRCIPLSDPFTNSHSLYYLLCSYVVFTLRAQSYFYRYFCPSLCYVRPSVTAGHSLSAYRPCLTCLSKFLSPFTSQEEYFDIYTDALLVLGAGKYTTASKGAQRAKGKRTPRTLQSQAGGQQRKCWRRQA